MTTSKLLSRQNVIQITSLLLHSGGGECTNETWWLLLSPLGEAAGACHVTPFLGRRRYTCSPSVKSAEFLATYGQRNSLRPQPCHFNYSLTGCWHRPPGPHCYWLPPCSCRLIIHPAAAAPRHRWGWGAWAWLLAFHLPEQATVFRGSPSATLIKTEKHIWYSSV